MAARKKQIELLPREGWGNSLLGRSLRWVLNVGRYIVIVTELIVILAFISRFKLDRDLTDLHEQIIQKQAVIEANREFEESFRFLQKRLETVGKIEQQQLAATGALDTLLPLIPLDISLSKIGIQDDRVNFTATGLSPQGLASLIRNLKNSPYFDKLTLSKISSGTKKTGGVEFQISALYFPSQEVY